MTELNPNIPTASNYETKTQEEHVLSNMEMYIGDRNPLPVDGLVFDGEKITQRSFIKSDALERLYLEILSNASDNTIRTRKAGMPSGKIAITMTPDTITIQNEGLPIPVEQHPKHQVWVPDLIFGRMLSSSNYTGVRHGAGINGIGAKAVNILSVYFSVEILDPIRHLYYKQEWRQNKTIRGEPVICPYNGNQSLVTITFVADFARFGFPSYTNDLLDLYRFHALNVSIGAKVPIIFNGVEYNIDNARDYAKLIFGDDLDKSILHYEWPEGTEVVKHKDIQRAKDGFTLPTVEMLVLDTPDDGQSYSFVNCIWTSQGGVHVNAAIDAVAGPTLHKINEETAKRLAKAKVEMTKKYALTIADVKPNISLLLFTNIISPVFESQSKHKLLRPGIKITLTDKEVEPISKWTLVERLYQARNTKQENLLRKTDGKRRGPGAGAPGREANDAGGKNSSQCILYLTEGDSGSGLINSMIDQLKKTDTWGVLPLRGKPRNVRDCDFLDLEQDRTFNLIKAYLGLEEGVDYSNEENFKKLRYGLVVLAADADDDGKHIIGLLLNYFEQRFPGLIQRGYIRYLRTPLFINRAKKLRFYTKEDYLQWLAQNPNSGEEIKYIKGLGTIDGDLDLPDILKYDLNGMYVQMEYDNQAPQWMRMAFDKSLADIRKQWVIQHTVDIRDTLDLSEPISKFVDNSMYLYTKSSLIRALPDAIDGFKPSQRKVIYTLNGYKNKKSIKVAQLGNATAEQTHYHHGETNLFGVIVNMAQDFIGSNNLPLLKKDGQFGSRFDGGSDAAAARYIFVSPNPDIFNKIFRKEDNPILTLNVEEGEEVEPIRYYPIIPNVLMNGASGIATGFSTLIPPHHPISLIDWLLGRLSGADPQQLPMLIPFYRGYTGEVEIVSTHKKGANDAKAEEAAQPIAEDDPFRDPESSDFFDGDRSKYSMVTTGKLIQVKDNGKLLDYKITELPIGVRPSTYLQWLQKLNEDTKFCKEIRNNSSGDTIDITLKGCHKALNEKDLRLRRSYGISNMVLLDEQGRPMIFETATHIIDYFYRKRLPVYEVRKQHDLNEINNNIIKLELTRRLCDLVLKNPERFLNVTKKDIEAFLSQYQIPFEIFSKVKLYQTSPEKIKELEKKIEEEKERYTRLFNTDVRQIWGSELMDLRQTLLSKFR